jgi:transcriptional regulator with XRE-family HTH domain
MDRGKPDAIFLLKISFDKYKPLAYMITMTGDELRKWREGNGYSQARLAKALAVAVMTVSRWERGVRALPPFLHLALRFLELEGGGPEIVRRGRKKKTETGKEV